MRRLYRIHIRLDGSMTYDAFSDLGPELAATRRVLEGLPADRFDWRPHPHSWTLGELATHIARLPLWIAMTAERDTLDLATLPPPGTPHATPEAVLDAFDASSAAAQAAVAAGIDLTAPWTLRRGERVVATMPRGTSLRANGISHLVHHRGQLTVYLRLLDLPVPGLYGPSGDDLRAARR